MLHLTVLSSTLFSSHLCVPSCGVWGINISLLLSGVYFETSWWFSPASPFSTFVFLFRKQFSYDLWESLYLWLLHPHSECLCFFPFSSHDYKSRGKNPAVYIAKAILQLWDAFFSMRKNTASEHMTDSYSLLSLSLYSVLKTPCTLSNNSKSLN